MPPPSLRARLAALAPILVLAACAAQPPAPAPSVADVAVAEPMAEPAAAPVPLPAADPPPAAAAQASPSAPADAPTVAEQAAEIADAARSTVRSSTVWLASGVDSWFGKRRFDEGGKVTDGRLELVVLKRQRESAEVDVRLNARLRLPNIDRLAYLYFGRDDERNVITDKPDALTRQNRLLVTQRQDRAFFAGLGRTLGDVFDFRLGVRGALKPYVQVRMRHYWQLDANDGLDLRETVFWTVDDRFGSTTAASYEHAFSATVVARWLGAATITQELPKIAWASSIGLFQTFGDQRLLSLEALVNGLQGSGVPALDYGLRAHWEQPIYENWLIGGIIVGHFWPRPDPLTVRRGAWALGTNLRMRF